MKGNRSPRDAGLAELGRRLQEAEETLEAIRSGAADALVVSGPEGDRVYTLKDADRPYRLVVEEMNEGAAALTPQGDVLFCNRCLAEMLRLPSEKVIGRSFSQYVTSCDRETFDELLRQAQHGSSKGEIALGEKDDEAVPAQMSLRNLSTVGLPMLSMVISDISERKRSEQRLRELSNQIERMQEDERRRVARELHDDIGQVLSVLRMSLEYTAEDMPADDTMARQRLRDASLLTEQMIERIRLLAGTLHPPALGVVSLNMVLEGYCRGWSQRTGVQVSYRGSEVGPVSDDQAIAFYRFLQEVLLNVERHAEAETVQVALFSDPAGVSLLVEDDGQGFDMRSLERPGAKQANGYGLFKMRERFAGMGGRLDIQSWRGRGTRLLAFLPVEREKTI